MNTPDAFENLAVFSLDGREILFVRDFHLYWRISSDASTGMCFPMIVQARFMPLLASGLFVVGLVSGCATTTEASRVTGTVTNRELAGTSWRLVEFQGSDDTLLIPDDGGKYTLAFGTDGRVAVRVDYNRGSGVWSSEGRSQLSFGPLALTRAMCPPESLHDRIVRDWEYVRSYVLQDGHLFLALVADGGIYEYEPASGGNN